MELLLLVAQHGTQAPLRKEMPALLEILHDTFRGTTPEQLLAAIQQRVQQEEAGGGSGGVLPGGEALLQVLAELAEDALEYQQHVYSSRTPLERFGAGRFGQ